MAALQKIRKTSWILVLMGVGLFLFLLTMVLDQGTINAITHGSRNVAGEVNGEKITAEAFLKEVNEALEVRKMRMGGNLNEMQQEQVREEVWQQMVQFGIVEKECQALGLAVTEAEVQQALREGRAGALQNMPMFINQIGQFDYKALQNFFKQAGTVGANANPQMLEQVNMVKGMWAYTEKVLRRELLFEKYASLLQNSFTANKLVAKSNFEDNHTSIQSTIAVLPYSQIKDSDVKITDEDLKAAYKRNKELFVLPTDAADIKYIDINVQASPTDKQALQKKMNDIYERLQATDKPASVVNASQSVVRYADYPISAVAFPQDIAAQLDSMAVGASKAPYLNLADNTMNIIKLYQKVQAPDSIQTQTIILQDADAKKLDTRTDSVLKALATGATFKDVAKKYGQPADSTWVMAQQFEGNTQNEENLKMIKAFYAQNVGEVKAIDLVGGVKMILKITDKKAIKSKYVAAVVKVPVTFSTNTYNAELSKFNRFIAANQNATNFEKNAMQAGYSVLSQDKFTTASQSIGGFGQYPGVEKSKEAVRWVFDTAEEGQVSPIYEVGGNNDHLLAVALIKKHKKGYYDWQDKQVKAYLTALVKSEKKAEIAATKWAKVKSVAQAKQQGATVQELIATFAANDVIEAIGQNEPALMGAMAKTAKGKETGLVLGRAAAFVAKVNNKTKASEKFDEKAELRNMQVYYSQMAGQQIFAQLTLKAKVLDLRYRF